MPCSALMRSAMATKSKPFQSPGTQKNSAPVWAHDEADLAVAVDRQDRVLHGAEAGQRQRQHDRLDPGGQLPGHRRAVPDAPAVEPGGHPLGAVA